MKKFIQNDWCQESGKSFVRSRILMYEIHPEGLDVDRIRFFMAGFFIPKLHVGHVISVLRGNGKLYLSWNYKKPLQLTAGVHQLGEYSDYDPLSEITQLESYAKYRREIARYDTMVNQLSLAKALGKLSALKKTAIWKLYLQGKISQTAIEARLINTLAEKNEKHGLFSYLSFGNFVRHN